ncbi:hypothetical protein GCM10023314_13590 [Algibacter agarivorans]|uniref:O-antigen ligase-related domain-containing protein n=1 Tax=Algibacter agarivorans TaxID=1109741 RepID=A0ABP9GHS0_9FLAO
MDNKAKKRLIYFLLFSLLIYSGIYLWTNYQLVNVAVSGIKVELNKNALDKGIPLLYTNRNKEATIDLQKPYRFKKINDSVIILDNLEDLDISKFRVYFEYPGTNYMFRKLTVFSKNLSNEISLDDIKEHEGVKKQDDLFFDVKMHNSFLEYPFVLIDKIPYLKITFGILFVGLLLYFFLLKTSVFDLLLTLKKEDILFAMFLLSIFSFAPLYNIALILGVPFYIKYFDWKLFKENKLNILFILFFIVYLINNICISNSVANEFSTIERFVPFIFIPILMASIKFSNALYYLMLSALAIGIVLFTSSLLDFIILERHEYFSFKQFSKYYHPVYLSYLFFLVICFLQQYYHHREKYILQGVFLLFLIFLGSKLVLLVAVPLYLLFHLNVKRKSVIFVVLCVMLLPSVLLFKPLQKRFNDILNFNDLSLLKETKIHDSNDSRVNGLTLRLILWKEAIATLNGFDEFAFGNGVSRLRAEDLRARLTSLGLIHHKGLNPHNQYVDTFWRTGFIGFIVLILIFAQSIIMGVKSKNKILLIFTLFLMFSFITESVFGRVRGVYFITVSLLILTNTNFNYKLKAIKNKETIIP